MSDLISRQDVYHILEKKIIDRPLDSDRWIIRDIDKAIRLLPSADRPTGEWIRSHLLPNGWHCSHCDSPVMTDDIDEMLFCPNCGAEMKGENK